MTVMIMFDQLSWDNLCLYILTPVSGVPGSDERRWPNNTAVLHPPNSASQTAQTLFRLSSASIWLIIADPSPLRLLGLPPP